MYTSFETRRYEAILQSESIGEKCVTQDLLSAELGLVN